MAKAKKATKTKIRKKDLKVMTTAGILWCD
jgi:hypothetical protein